LGQLFLWPYQLQLHVTSRPADGGNSFFTYHSERFSTSTFAKATAGQAGHLHHVLRGKHPILVLVNLGLPALIAAGVFAGQANWRRVDISGETLKSPAG
jgi:hypothetical protein